MLLMVPRITVAGDNSNNSNSSNNERSADDRRRAPRILVDLEVDYGNEENFLFAYIHDISETGIFIRTESPEPKGTQLNVRFTPHGDTADHDPVPLELEGEVIWVNAFRPSRSDSIHPGMGVRFLDLTTEQRHRLTAFVKTFAYLGDDAASDSADDAASESAGDAASDSADDAASDSADDAAS